MEVIRWQHLGELSSFVALRLFHFCIVPSYIAHATHSLTYLTYSPIFCCDPSPAHFTHITWCLVWSCGSFGWRKTITSIGASLFWPPLSFWDIPVPHWWVRLVNYSTTFMEISYDWVEIFFSVICSKNINLARNCFGIIMKENVLTLNF